MRDLASNLPFDTSHCSNDCNSDCAVSLTFTLSDASEDVARFKHFLEYLRSKNAFLVFREQSGRLTWRQDMLDREN